MCGFNGSCDMKDFAISRQQICIRGEVFPECATATQYSFSHLSLLVLCVEFSDFFALQV
jgi:hypothetical protein